MKPQKISTTPESYLLASIILMILCTGFACFLVWEMNFSNEGWASTDPDIIKHIKEYKELEKLIERQRQRGWTSGPLEPTLSDRVKSELLVINNNNLINLNIAINRFNRSTTILSIIMIALSILMAVLVVFQIRLKVSEEKLQVPPEPMRFTY